MSSSKPLVGIMTTIAGFAGNLPLSNEYRDGALQGPLARACTRKGASLAFSNFRYPEYMESAYSFQHVIMD